MAGHLTHAGFAIMLLGIIASAAYSGEETLTLTSGETVSAYGADIQFVGAVRGDTPEEGYIDLRLIRNGDTTQARPKLYVSEYSQQVMRTVDADMASMVVAAMERQGDRMIVRQQRRQSDAARQPNQSGAIIDTVRAPDSGRSTSIRKANLPVHWR